jgi:hypothetical protein
VQPLWKALWRSLQKLKIEPPYNPEIPMVIHPKECSLAYNGASCPSMFIAALVTTAKLWKYPRCSTTDERRKCGIYTQWSFVQP